MSRRFSFSDCKLNHINQIKSIFMSKSSSTRTACPSRGGQAMHVCVCVVVVVVGGGIPHLIERTTRGPEQIVAPNRRHRESGVIGEEAAHLANRSLTSHCLTRTHGPLSHPAAHLGSTATGSVPGTSAPLSWRYHLLSLRAAYVSPPTRAARHHDKCNPMQSNHIKPKRHASYGFGAAVGHPLTPADQ